MLEVVFSDSAGGCLMLAQRFGEGKHCGTVGVLFSKEDGTEPTKKEWDEVARRKE